MFIQYSMLKFCKHTLKKLVYNSILPTILKNTWASPGREFRRGSPHARYAAPPPPRSMLLHMLSLQHPHMCYPCSTPSRWHHVCRLSHARQLLHIMHAAGHPAPPACTAVAAQHARRPSRAPSVHSSCAAHHAWLVLRPQLGFEVGNIGSIRFWAPFFVGGSYKLQQRCNCTYRDVNWYLFIIAKSHLHTQKSSLKNPMPPQ